MTGSEPINKFSFRPMRPEDIEQVHAIDQASFALPWPKSAYLYELYDNPNSFLFVAEARETFRHRIVGMVVVWLILDEAHIATIAVHPDYRQQGIGQQLLFVALQEAIHREASQATLEVRAQNFAAQQMYRQFRFVEVGRRPRYYRDNYEDALIMTVEHLGEEYLKWLEGFGWRHQDSGRQADRPPA